MFTNQYNDEATDLYDFLAREQHRAQGRWISPDPAGLGAVDPGNPQSWNRYAYVVNDPTGFLDPLGLHCASPDLGACHPDTSYFFWSVYWNLSTAAAEAAKTQGGNYYYRYVPGSSYMVPTGLDQNGDPTYTIYDTLGGWQLIGRDWSGPAASISLPANNFSWWGTFFRTLGNGLLNGVRQPGQSLGECMDQNVTNMTFGEVDPQKLFDPSLLKLEASSVIASIKALPTPFGPVALGPYTARWVAGGLGAGAVARGLASTAARAGFTAAAVAGAATAGAAIGSAINCR